MDGDINNMIAGNGQPVDPVVEGKSEITYVAGSKGTVKLEPFCL
jgi:hypothetical protein